MENKLRTMLRHKPARQAGLCFLAACAIAFACSLLARNFLYAVASLAFLIGNLIALRLIRNAGPRAPKATARKYVTPALILFCLSTVLTLVPVTSVRAQSPSPTPPRLQPQPTPPFEAGNPSGQLSELLNHVRELVPYIRRQIERPMLQKFKTLAMILGSLVLLFSFIRVIRENDGASQELYYWGARAAIFMAFFALAPSIVSTLYKIGRTLTIPIESSIEERREAFNKTYYEFVHGTYIVKDEQKIYLEPIYLKPGEDGWVGVLTDGEVGTSGKMKGLEQLEKSADLTSWHMDKLFLGLNVSRGILQAGEIFLLLLGGFIMIGLRLAAPFMVAIAIDKKLAERITYPFVWGTVVFTLVFPVVRDVLTYIAYTVGSFGLMMYKGEPLYSIDPATANIVQTGSYYNPTLIIIMSFVLMTICGLMLWLSPYLSYRIATGQVFEAVSSTASGWMAAMVGSAIEFAGLKAGASLQRQAENTQTQAGWTAEMTRAKGTLEVSNLGAQARKISGAAAIQGNLQTTLAAIHAGATQTRMSSMANQNFTVASVAAQVGDSNRQVGYRRDQNITQKNLGFDLESNRIATESSARKKELWGTAVGGSVPFGGGTVIAEQGGFAQNQRTRNYNALNEIDRYVTNRNEFGTADKIQSSQTTYQENMTTAAKNNYAEQVKAADTAEGIAAGGAKSGAGTALGGVNKAYSLEMQGNQIQYDTTSAAAGVIKDAGFRAAKMREVSSVISGVARDMDRRIEEGMRQRY